MWVLGRFLLLAVVALSVAGCGANFSTAYRTYSIEGTASSPTRPQSIVIDAKQRVIVTSPGESIVTTTKTQSFGDGDGSKSKSTTIKTVEKRRLIVCAEPSPDALSAITSNFAASFGGVFGPSKEVQAALANSFSETASQLGVRNATIQLLRDGLYRQCEAYMNGLIGRPYYEQIANKYVNAMVTLLAIEEITPNKAKAVTIKADKGSVATADTNITVSALKEETEDDLTDKDDTEGEPSDATSTTESENSTGGEPASPSGTGGTQDSNQTGGGKKNQSATGKAKAESASPVVNVNLPDEDGSVEPHVSNAVNTMVTWFLTKDTVDYCLRGLFAGETPTGGNLDTAFVKVCQQVIRDQMAQQGDVAAAFASSTAAGSFGEDDCSMALRSFWKPGGVFDDENQTKIQTAMAQIGFGNSLPYLLSTSESADSRKKVGQVLGLPDCR